MAPRGRALWVQLLGLLRQGLADGAEELRRGQAQLGEGPGGDGEMLGLTTGRSPF